MFGQKPTQEQALPGRTVPLQITNRHFVLDRPLKPPFPAGMKSVLFGMGCFWGAERCFWTQKGVYTTAVGYAGGYTQNANYEELCTGLTGHAEVVLVVYDPDAVSFARLLGVFWESHDPTQGMRQGADIGTQYRSAIYCYDDEQLDEAEDGRDRYQKLLAQQRYAKITTEILRAPPFYYAEDYHQQYLAKNPDGYCGLGGCGIAFSATTPSATAL
jgi:peptide-methionine (S)-S-oxide reductase